MVCYSFLPLLVFLVVGCVFGTARAESCNQSPICSSFQFLCPDPLGDPARTQCCTLTYGSQTPTCANACCEPSKSSSVVGIVVGIIVAIIVLVVLIACYCSNKSHSTTSSTATTSTTTPTIRTSNFNSVDNTQTFRNPPPTLQPYPPAQTSYPPPPPPMNSTPTAPPPSYEPYDYQSPGYSSI
eukprot:m.3766 g.3766  ORF g.3766 m.3766 type:complete len:183 (+) comp2122_c0_seq1:65-613(+)